MLLLHGWQHSSANMLELAKRLAQSFTVYLVDLPGFGKSESLPNDPSTSDYVQTVRAFIAEQKIQPIIIGHSFGGRLAVKLAALYPEILAGKLILIGTPGIRRKSSLRVLILKYVARLLKLIDRCLRTKLFKNYFAPRYASRDYQQAGQLKALFVKTVNEDLSPFAAKVRQKTLLLWGANDTEAPLVQGRSYNNLIINSDLVVLPYHDHVPFADVGAHYCAKLIEEFIDAE